VEGVTTLSSAKQTTDHEIIRRWAEKRGGRPARIAATAPAKSAGRTGSSGILRIDFDAPNESLEPISWEEFYRTFDKQKLALLYQDEDDSRFQKFVERD
jgi:hypothetical protein